MTYLELVGAFGMPIEQAIDLGDTPRDPSVVHKMDFECGCTAQHEFMGDLDDWRIIIQCEDFDFNHGTKLTALGIPPTGVLWA